MNNREKILIYLNSLSDENLIEFLIDFNICPINVGLKDPENCFNTECEDCWKRIIGCL